MSTYVGVWVFSAATWADVTKEVARAWEAG